MAISLEALRILDAIARRGSFAAAADELDKVPSAVTYVVRKLEGDLDVLLFDRRGHRARLTPAGAELLREGRNLLTQSDELERRVRRVGDGWEVELRLAIDDVLRPEPVFDLLKRFYGCGAPTRVRLATEVLSGTWDALAAGRADLALGLTASTSGGGDGGVGFSVESLGEFEMVFAVAPDHPLAQLPEPLAAADIRRHRAVAVGDTSRHLPPLTIGLLQGQDVLTVASMEAKIAAQVAGLGCGYLPLGLALPHLEAGRLVARLTGEPRRVARLYYGWRSSARGKALRWFLEALSEPLVRSALLP